MITSPATLKEYCKLNGYSFRQRRQGNRYYVTIADKSLAKLSPRDLGQYNWLSAYQHAVYSYYPNAHMTSGSMFGATFMIGDIIEALKGNT